MSRTKQLVEPECYAPADLVGGDEQATDSPLVPVNASLQSLTIGQRVQAYLRGEPPTGLPDSRRCWPEVTEQDFFDTLSIAGLV